MPDKTRGIGRGPRFEAGHVFRVVVLQVEIAVAAKRISDRQAAIFSVMGTKMTDEGPQAADAEGNLMSTGKYDVEQQAAIAWGWEKSGLSQEAWAKKHGITARTLRLYLRRHCPARHWNEEIQAVVLCANQALTEILKTMGPSETPAPRPAAATAPGPRAKFNWGD